MLIKFTPGQQDEHDEVGEESSEPDDLEIATEMIIVN